MLPCGCESVTRPRVSRLQRVLPTSAQHGDDVWLTQRLPEARELLLVVGQVSYDGG